jgi:asparagine synthase (glutamine-hydrolysing)
MRRLSIIDVAGGKQPISNEDGSITVVFNGEIYNHHELRRELLGKGHRFATRSDTEVLVHMYEQYSFEMLKRLKGMFAFALWDANARRLMIARDRTGMKPLSYRADADGIAFCSELRSLIALDASRLEVSADSITKYLAFGYVPEPLTIFKGVRKLPPGHFLTWSRCDGVREMPYWVPPRAQIAAVDQRELVSTLLRKLDSAVASHLEAEVPLGAFLSGGLDSSTVVALMCRHASGRVKTFSIGFAEEQFDESPAARAVAQHFGTDHTELIVRPDVERVFEAIATMFDEPFADSSAIPTFLVAQLARRSVKVALSGDGGDELFGGYTRYSETLASRLRDPSAMDRLMSATGLMLPHVFPGRNRLVNRGRDKWGRFASTVVQPLRVEEGGIARPEAIGGAALIREQLEEQISDEFGEDFAASMMRVDLKTYLPGDILAKVDRTSMAVSLEARVPLLDFDLVDFALQIPGPMRVVPGQTKRMFREAIREIVPEFVLNRPKQGFAIPLGRWFRGPLRYRIEALKSLSVALQPYVDQSVVRRIVREHSFGRRDHAAVLWRLMVLEIWLDALRSGRLCRAVDPPQLSFE